MVSAIPSDIYMFFAFVIASAAIVLAWLRTKEKERSQKIHNLPVLVTCRSDSLVHMAGHSWNHVVRWLWLPHSC